ncbi:TetR/AcrR family transcriptional regulator [Glaciibacter sp. 2TAF33]|uniref:TetR/AcrR family transcriptional regulator n=1 Tax=Glaciibacter sp. 2TAF33 TaxID=3233015 RepID=UPI003F90277E
MVAKDRWIEEGLVVLREQGIGGLRVDRVARRLGLTKGSFHHHFSGVDDYHRSLLERYESDAVAVIETAVASLDHLSAERALMEAPSYAPVDPGLEAAIRGWGSHDEAARATLGRIDAARLQALIRLWQGVVTDPTMARTAAMIPYLITIGASVTVPTPTQEEIGDIFALLAALVPLVPGTRPDPARSGDGSIT